MKRVLVTGANRGIGLEFVRQYVADGWQVTACCRTPKTAGSLQEMAEANPDTITILALDVDDAKSVAGLKKALQGQEFDVIINNAGVIGDRTAMVGSMDYESLTETLQTNVLGPLRVTESLWQNLKSDGERKIATVSSKMGALAHCQPNALIYRTSKAAVNMAMRCAALQLRDENVITFVMHPGWVQTDMGGPNADIDTKTSVSGMRGVIANASAASNGEFFNYDGEPLPW